MKKVNRTLEPTCTSLMLGTLRMITFRLVLLLSCFATSVHAQDLKARLAVSNTTDDIREFCSRFRQFGEQHEATYTTGNTKLFVAWVQPKEGASPAFLFAYVFRAGKWLAR